MTPKPNRYLSKSQFTRGMQCPKSLWLYRERKELQDAVDPDQQAIFDAGTKVGVLAQSWIKGGVLIKAGHQHPQAALAETAAAIGAGAKVLYEAAFVHDDVLVRVDILAQGPGGVWDLYEVKSTTDVEDVYLLDVAIQRYVLQGAGLELGVCHVAHLNPAYIRKGELDLTQLFTAVDVNAPTAKILPNVPKQLERMKADNAQPEPPEVGIGPHCTKPHDCSFKGHCWKAAGVPPYSVFNLAGARMDKKTDLWNNGYKLITDIQNCSCKPTAKKCTCGRKLTAYQNAQRQVAMTKMPAIDRGSIREHLNLLRYPLYFLDFEAVNLAIPPYDYMRPYQQLPFEASIHLRRAPGGPLEHFEYLADGSRDPRPGLIDFLVEHLANNGSIIAYNKSYEGNIMAALALLGDLLKAPRMNVLLDAGRRLWDLADPFKQALWADPRFEGSWSIKKVLPALVPAMTYEGMAIADGAAAMRAYERLMDPETPPGEKAQIMKDLKAYCGQDTLAMVRILDVVEAEVGAHQEAAR